MKCVYCEEEYSETVCRIHREQCKIIKENKDIKPLTNRDLIVKILSEKEGYEESKLSKLKKVDLLKIIEGE